MTKCEIWTQRQIEFFGIIVYRFTGAREVIKIQSFRKCFEGYRFTDGNGTTCMNDVALESGKHLYGFDSGQPSLIGCACAH